MRDSLVSNPTPVRGILGYDDKKPYLRKIDVDQATVSPAEGNLDRIREGISELVPLKTWTAIRCGGEIWSLPIPMQGDAKRIAASFISIPDAETDSLWVQDTSGPAVTCFRVDADGRMCSEQTILAADRLIAVTPVGWVVRNTTSQSGPSQFTYHMWNAGKLEGLGTGHHLATTRATMLLADQPGRTLSVVDLATRRSHVLENPALTMSWVSVRAVVSPDSRYAALRGRVDRKRTGVFVVDLETQLVNEAVHVEEVEFGDFGVTWSADSEWLFVATSGSRRNDLLTVGARSSGFVMQPIMKGRIPLLLIDASRTARDRRRQR